MDEIDHLDIRTLIQIKDAVIEELAEEVTASRVNKKQLKADSHQMQQSVFSAVDCANAEIRNFQDPCRNATICRRCTH